MHEADRFTKADRKALRKKLGLNYKKTADHADAFVRSLPTRNKSTFQRSELEELQLITPEIFLERFFEEHFQRAPLGTHLEEGEKLTRGFEAWKRILEEDYGKRTDNASRDAADIINALDLQQAHIFARNKEQKYRDVERSLPYGTKERNQAFNNFRRWNTYADITSFAQLIQEANIQPTT